MKKIDQELLSPLLHITASKFDGNYCNRFEGKTALSTTKEKLKNIAEMYNCVEVYNDREAGNATEPSTLGGVFIHFMTIYVLSLDDLLMREGFESEEEIYTHIRKYSDTHNKLLELRNHMQHSLDFANFSANFDHETKHFFPDLNQAFKDLNQCLDDIITNQPPVEELVVHQAVLFPCVVHLLHREINYVGACKTLMSKVDDHNRKAEIKAEVREKARNAANAKHARTHRVITHCLNLYGEKRRANPKLNMREAIAEICKDAIDFDDREKGTNTFKDENQAFNRIEKWVYNDIKS